MPVDKNYDVPVDKLIAEEGDKGVQILAGTVQVGGMVVGLQGHQKSCQQGVQNWQINQSNLSEILTAFFMILSYSLDVRHVPLHIVLPF
jgi:hypothetical protein